MNTTALNNVLGADLTWNEVDCFLFKSTCGEAIASKWSDGTWRLRFEGAEWALDTSGTILKKF